MDKENGDAADRGEKGGSAAGAPADAASLLDAASLFGECNNDDQPINHRVTFFG
jgi:hypothetical protein